MKKELNNFIKYWRAYRSSSDVDIDFYFRRHVSRKASRLKENNRYAMTEKDLQAYLYLNIEDIFPDCKELLIYERPLMDRFSTNTGKFDFLFLTKKKCLKLIETKVIDTRASGSTAQARRRRHRQKVENQVIGGKFQLCCLLKIPDKKVECAVYSTDPSLSRRLSWSSNQCIDSTYISLGNLREWFENKAQQYDIEHGGLSFNYHLDMQDFGWP